MKDQFATIADQWEPALLEDVVTLHYGKALAKGERNPVGLVAVYGANGIKDRADVALTEGPSLIIGRKGSAGEVTRVDGSFWPLDVTYYTTHDESRVDFDFLEYALSTLNLPSLARGVKPGINRNDVYSLPLPLPPLEEQKRIVAVLDQAFAVLDRARAHAEANLADAGALFAAMLNKRFERLATTARIRPLIDLCSDRGVTYGVIKLGDHIEGGVPCLRTSNVKPLNVDVEGMKHISSALSDEYSRTILRGGEVLVNVRGTLGGVAVVPPGMAGWNISREVAMIDIKKAEPLFVAYAISTLSAQNWLKGVTKGAAYKGINLSDLRNLLIPIPNTDEQLSVVHELDTQRSLVQTLEEKYVRKISDLSTLRQSLLQKAFSGQLT